MISEIFDDISSSVSKEALELFGESGDDISVNKPLRENLIVILTSIALSIHVLICGKPGTSKTLAIEIAYKILSMNFQDKPHLCHFKKANFSKFWGSRSTTSEGVRKKFDSTIADYLKNLDSDETKVLIFDEIGLAEQAPDNPLKVLHSYLDPASEDRSDHLKELLEEKSKLIKDFEKKTPVEKARIFAEIEKKTIAFVGVSNWRLDVSKSNRMIFVARPKMGLEDLVDTSKSMLESHLKKMNIASSQYPENRESLDQIFEIIAQVYTTFREYQIKKSQDDKNMHGSRDYYYLIRHIIYYSDLACST